MSAHAHRTDPAEPAEPTRAEQPRSPPALQARAATWLASCALWLLALPGQAQSLCPGQPLCREVPGFSATVTEFRVSPSTLGNRPVNLTVRFVNKTGRPLTLGHVAGTAAAFDDRANKYTLQNSRKLLGMGLIERNRFDPKFTLGPSESADAKLELNFFVNRNVIVGTAFDLEMSVREIDPLPGQQFRLGREHALSWQGLSNGAGAGTATSSPVAARHPGGEPAAPTGPASVPSDPCAGHAHCTASGPVLARVVAATPSTRGNYHHVAMRISFQNIGDSPLILNYKQDTGHAIDERGQQYDVDSRDRQSVQGIPASTRDRASSQFTLRPGESRTASFDFRRYTGKVPAGAVLSPSIAVEQYELLASNQLRLQREYALGFGEVRTTPQLQDVGRALKDLRKLFKDKD